MFTPNNLEIASEFASQSFVIFGIIGLDGIVGPSMEEYDRYRPDGWPHSEYMLKMFGLLKNAGGWKILLHAFGFTPPTPHEIQVSSQRRREENSSRPSIPIRDDESFLPLTGNLVGEQTTLTPLGDDWYRRTVRSIVSLR